MDHRAITSPEDGVSTNNIAAVLFIALDGPGSGLALYRLPLEMDDPRLGEMMLPEFATLFCGWLAARLALKV